MKRSAAGPRATRVNFWLAVNSADADGFNDGDCDLEVAPL
jgi:hypothetical protein